MADSSPEATPVNKEWVVGYSPAPYHLAEDEASTPYVVIIMEPPVVIGSDLVSPYQLPDWENILNSTMNAPQFGNPRKPKTIRVSDQKLASTLAETFSDIGIVCAPTPELDSALSELEVQFSCEPELSYSRSGEISLELVSDLFEASELLYNIKPWQNMYDSDIMRVDIPSIGLEGGCLTVIGNAGDDFGLLFFPEISGYDRFIQLANGNKPSSDKGEQATLMISLNFEKATNIPTNMRREAARNCWPVASPEAYPIVTHLRSDLSRIPPTYEDYKLINGLARTFIGFYNKQSAIFDCEEVKPVSLTVECSDLQVRYTYPVDGLDLFED